MKQLKSLAMATIAGSAIAMTGCSSTGTGYNTSMQNASNTAKGTLGGAAVGALIRSGGDSKDIARGALAGAALGGAGGYVLDKNEENQQQQQYQNPNYNYQR